MVGQGIKNSLFFLELCNPRRHPVIKEHSAQLMYILRRYVQNAEDLMCILAGFCPSDGGPVRLGLSLWSRALVRYDQPTNSFLSIGNAAVYIILLKS